MLMQFAVLDEGYVVLVGRTHDAMLVGIECRVVRLQERSFVGIARRVGEHYIASSQRKSIVYALLCSQLSRASLRTT